MKVKLKTQDHAIVGFSRRELVLINNCLNEACNGMLMDSFVPAHDELVKMLECVKGITKSEDFFKVNPVNV